MRALIQQKQGRFADMSYFSAALGFEELGYEVVLVDDSAFDSFDLSPDTLPVGEIPRMLASFARLGIDYQPLKYIPAELDDLAGRRTWSTTLGAARDRVGSGEPMFVKPAEESPRFFKGQVLRTFRDLIRTANCAAETPVWCSELVDFVSEYRVFVCAREIVGMKHYFGDFRVFPNVPTIEDAVARCQQPPAGFAIDFGITREGETLIVEQNDGFSLGSYGLHPVVYAKLLVARWAEIVGRF